MSDAPTECARETCWLAPAFDAVLILRSKLHRKALGVAPLGVQLCAGHAAETKLDDLIDDETWEKIRAGFVKSGRVPPDRELCELDLVPLNLEA